MRVRTDDDVYRVNAVWLGPKGLTFPWTARYLAYGIWLLIFCVILAIEAITPLSVGVPPLWEVTISILATYGLMGLVDHDRPVKSVAEMLFAEVSAPRQNTTRTRVRVRTRYQVRQRLAEEERHLGAHADQRRLDRGSREEVPRP
jgi:hypothetical protein